jgi:hypothetical protein
LDAIKVKGFAVIREHDVGLIAGVFERLQEKQIGTTGRN